MLPVSQCRKGGRPNQDDPCSAASAKLQTRAGPLLEELQRWLEASLRRVPGRSELAAAIRYARSRWAQLCRYRDDGRPSADAARGVRHTVGRQGAQEDQLRLCLLEDTTIDVGR
jgi:hypothetical protein